LTEAQIGQVRTLSEAVVNAAEEKTMSNNNTPMLSAVSAAFGAFLSALTPSEWPWYFELLTVLAAAVTVFVVTKFVVRGEH
jgi:hypothetical protein